MSKYTKVAASVTIHRIPGMTPKGRKEICDWLRMLARNIQRSPDSFAETFRAQWNYAPKK
jgi:hypothetical protein